MRDGQTLKHSAVSPVCCCHLHLTARTSEMSNARVLFYPCFVVGLRLEPSRCRCVTVHCFVLVVRSLLVFNFGECRNSCTVNSYDMPYLCGRWKLLRWQISESRTMLFNGGIMSIQCNTVTSLVGRLCGSVCLERKIDFNAELILVLPKCQILLLWRHRRCWLIAYQFELFLTVIDKLSIEVINFSAELLLLPKLIRSLIESRLSLFTLFLPNCQMLWLWRHSQIAMTNDIVKCCCLYS